VQLSIEGEFPGYAFSISGEPLRHRRHGAAFLSCGFNSSSTVLEALAIGGP
jgi:hypothetical protein